MCSFWGQEYEASVFESNVEHVSHLHVWEEKWKNQLCYTQPLKSIKHDSILQGMFLPQGIFKGHSWEMVINEEVINRNQLECFYLGLLVKSAASHAARFLSWWCCLLAPRGYYEIKIWTGQKIRVWWAELAHTSNDAFVVRHGNKDASWNLACGNQTQKPFVC